MDKIKKQSKIRSLYIILALLIMIFAMVVCYIYKEYTPNKPYETMHGTYDSNTFVVNQKLNARLDNIYLNDFYVTPNMVVELDDYNHIKNIDVTEVKVNNLNISDVKVNKIDNYKYIVNLGYKTGEIDCLMVQVMDDNDYRTLDKYADIKYNLSVLDKNMVFYTLQNCSDSFVFHISINPKLKQWYIRNYYQT